MMLKDELNQIYKKAIVREREELVKLAKEKKLLIKKRKKLAMEKLDNYCNDVIGRLKEAANNGNKFIYIKFYSEEEQFYIVDEILKYINNMGLSCKKEKTQIFVQESPNGYGSQKDAWELFFEW